jgi:hypothetical protein
MRQVGRHASISAAAERVFRAEESRWSAYVWFEQALACIVFQALACIACILNEQCLPSQAGEVLQWAHNGAADRLGRAGQHSMEQLSVQWLRAGACAVY